MKSIENDLRPLNISVVGGASNAIAVGHNVSLKHKLKILIILVFFLALTDASLFSQTVKNDSTKNQLKKNDSFVFQTDRIISNSSNLYFYNEKVYINKHWKCFLMDSSYKISKIIKHVNAAENLLVICNYIETKSDVPNDTLIFCKVKEPNEYPGYCLKVISQGKTVIIMYNNHKLKEYLKNNFKDFL